MPTVYLPFIANNSEETQEGTGGVMKPIVDISYWQQGIDYDKFAASISGAILRGAYGVWKDTWFETHYSELSKRGVPIGSYHYVIGNYSGKQQAQIFYDIVKDKELKLGLWNDVEDRRDGTALSSSVVIDYHTNIESLYGKKVGIYTGVYCWYEIMLDKSKLFGDRDLWIAHYGVIEPSLPRSGGWTKWLLWQYTSSGRFDGYYGNVDSNNFNGTEEEYKDYFNLDGEEEPTIPIGSFYCCYCDQYTPNDSYGHCSKCGAPREDWIPEPTSITLYTVRAVNIRSLPSTSSSVNGVREVGEEVKIKDIYVESPTAVWVEDYKGWSALVYGGVKYIN